MTPVDKELWYIRERICMLRNYAKRWPSVYGEIVRLNEKHLIKIIKKKHNEKPNA